MKINYYKLSDLCVDIIDCPHSTPIWKESGVRVVRNFNLKDGNLDFSNGFYVDESTYQDRIKRAMPEQDDIIISREAPMGVVAIIPKDLKCCLGQRLVLLKVDKSKIAPFYLLSILRSEYVQTQFRRADVTGSTVSNLCIPDLKNIIIPVVEINQSQNAKLLKNINEKIVVNSKINDNLAQMLRLLYEQWFYRFEFPNEQNLPYNRANGELEWNDKLKRRIPKGWKVQTMLSNELFSVISSGIDRFSTKKYYATADIIGSSIGEGSDIEYETRESRANMQPVINSVWFAKMKNSIKHLFLNKEMSSFVDNSILSTGFYGLKCNEISFEYIASVVFAPIFEITKDRLSHGATQQGIGDDDMANITLLIPDDTTLRKYHETTKGFFAKISNNILENKRLIATRNFLLPLLMNGQATIAE